MSSIGLLLISIGLAPTSDLLARDLTENNMPPPGVAITRAGRRFTVERSEMEKRRHRPLQVVPRLTLLGPEPVFPEHGFACKGGVRDGFLAPGLEEPDEIKHFAIGQGREVFEFADGFNLHISKLFTMSMRNDRSWGSYRSSTGSACR